MALPQTVSQPTSYTNLTSSANPSAPGQAITLTATVGSMSGGTPSGTVTFKDGAMVLGTGTLGAVNGIAQATFTTSAPALGSHSLTAVYGGDETFAGSSSMALPQTVSQPTSYTNLMSSANPSAPGQAVTFTATVGSMSGGTPTGPVTFYDGATLLGTGTLSVVNGIDQATFTTSALALGSHSLTAVYGGDGTFAGSSSMPLTQTVSLKSTSTTVISSANPSSVGQAVTFTATVVSPLGARRRAP